MRFEIAHHLRDSVPIAHAGRDERMSFEANDRARKLERDLLESANIVDGVSCAGTDRREFTQWRNPVLIECRACSGGANQFLELLGCELKRYASIADTVRMRAFERFAGSSEHQRARRHQQWTLAASIGEGPAEQERYRRPSVTLLERTVVRAGGANHVERAPSIALRENASEVATARTIALLAKDGVHKRIAVNRCRQQFLPSLPSGDVIIFAQVQTPKGESPWPWKADARAAPSGTSSPTHHSSCTRVIVAIASASPEAPTSSTSGSSASSSSAAAPNR